MLAFCTDQGEHDYRKIQKIPYLRKTWPKNVAVGLKGRLTTNK